MRRAMLFLGLLVLPLAAGCESCFELDRYEIVETVSSSSSSTTTSTSSTGGGGGDGPTCTGTGEGVLVAVLPVEQWLSADGPPECPASDAFDGAIELIAFDAQDGTCRGRDRIGHAGGATSRVPMRVHYDGNGPFYVAGTWQGGSLDLPRDCTTLGSVSLDLEPGASEAIFVARLAFVNPDFCTEWARRAWPTSPAAAGSLAVDAIATEPSGALAIAGTLGGTTVAFEDMGTTFDADGGGFFARYSLDGDLDGVTTLGAGRALGVASHAGNWVATGTTALEDPSCHGCTGSSLVTAAADTCGGQGGAGGGGGGGGGGGAAPGSDNAFVWEPAGDCGRLDTYGSDALGTEDPQVGLGLASGTASAECTLYWGGMAGVEPWTLHAQDPPNTLFDPMGTSRDAFVARFTSCASPHLTEWSLRLVPSSPMGSAWTERVSTGPCSNDVVASVVVRDSPNGTVAAHVCPTGERCQPMPLFVTLTDTATQLVVASLGSSGARRWSTAIGPLVVEDIGPYGAPADRVVLDDRDDPHLLVRTGDGLAIERMDTTACGDLDQGSPSGTWLIELERLGSGDEAVCSWARRVGP
jgi:hypothetical protein